MSVRETAMIHAYWERVGGTLIEEYPAVQPSATCGARRIDAIILPNGEPRRIRGQQVPLQGQDVDVVQAKASRLGMYLMGQVVFSAELIRRFGPRSIRSIALCTQDDSV